MDFVKDVHLAEESDSLIHMNKLFSSPAKVTEHKILGLKSQFAQILSSMPATACTLHFRFFKLTNHLKLN